MKQDILGAFGHRFITGCHVAAKCACSVVLGLHAIIVSIYVVPHLCSPHHPLDQYEAEFLYICGRVQAIPTYRVYQLQREEEEEEEEEEGRGGNKERQ